MPDAGRWRIKKAASSKKLPFLSFIATHRDFSRRIYIFKINSPPFFYSLAYSSAPMSMRLPCGLVSPSISVSGTSFDVPAFIAGDFSVKW